MQWFRTVAAAAMLAAVVGSMVVTTSSADARPEPGTRQGPFGCAVKDSLGKRDNLRPGRALCNRDYLLRMQGNGDLVLRKISTGRACWHSNTFVAGVSTTFTPGAAELKAGLASHGDIPPKLKIGKRVIKGENIQAVPPFQSAHDGTSANLNSKGEFFIGYRMVGSC
jgi:hypothetical protein